MPRYRIRYHATDLELPVGEFVIGRSSSCGLALDDGLVSRRHAVIHVDGERIELEDLGSRNGVSVNGEKVEGTRILRHLDRVTIGSQEIVLFEIATRESEGRRTTEMRVCPKCHGLAESIAETCPSCNSPMIDPGATIAGDVAPMGSGRATGAFALITGIAEKGLALGRFEETERMLGTHLDELLSRAKGGSPMDTNQLELASDFALRLAEGLPRHKWISWDFEVYATSGKLMDGEHIDRLHDLVRKIGYSELKPIRGYLDLLQDRTGNMSSADRFLLKRLEALDRVIAAS